MASKGRVLNPNQTRRIYDAFLKAASGAELAQTLGHMQVFLDHVVGNYLDAGEEDLHDPSIFANVVAFHKGLLAAQRGDYSLLPSLASMQPDDEPGYDMDADVIRLTAREIASLEQAAKQIENSLPIVFRMRSIQS